LTHLGGAPGVKEALNAAETVAAAHDILHSLRPARAA
ncbi:MAG: hypothetical protein QOI98_1413, partial [Solirubrobacteraceae bacterium]|nr:hypothetical protein [Solirubrobacteraceae bacterium]